MIKRSVFWTNRSKWLAQAPINYENISNGCRNHQIINKLIDYDVMLQKTNMVAKDIANQDGI